MPVARTYRRTRTSGLALLMLACSWISYAQPTPLPEGDLYGGQTFSPTVELLLAASNGILTGYNGYLIAQHRRRSLAGGIAVVTGAIGIAIGIRETANYPVLDLAMGGAAVLTGGAQMLLSRFRLWPTAHLGPLRINPTWIPITGDVRPALAVRVASP